MRRLLLGLPLLVPLVFLGSGARSMAAPSAKPADSSMVSALDHLKKAKAKLAAAPDDSAGDRASALAATDRAILAVERALGVAPVASAGAKSLDPAAISATIAAQKATLRKICFQPYAAGGNANVKVDLRIGPSGIVNDAVLLEQPTGDARVGRCVVGQAWWWKFPAAGTDTNVVVPFVFTN